MTIQELGKLICEKREAMGLSLAEVADRIKVSARILRSIEAGSTQGLPHAVYTKSFTRSFGLLVGVDPEVLGQALDSAFPPETIDDSVSDHGPLSRPLPPPPGAGKKLLALLLVLALLIGGAFGGWYIVTAHGSSLKEWIKQPFSALTVPEPVSAQKGFQASMASPVASNLGTPPVVAPVSTSGDPPPPAAASSASVSSPPVIAPTSSIPSPAVTLASASAALASEASETATTRGQSVIGSPEKKSSLALQQVMFTARSNCWVGSKADGGTGREYTVKTGESFTLTFTRSIDIVLGNATGVDILYNGTPYKPAVDSSRRTTKFSLP